MDYCLINMLGKVNKFFIDNWFSKSIIKKIRIKLGHQQMLYQTSF